MNGYVQHYAQYYVHYGAQNSVHSNNAQTIMHNNVQPHNNSEQIDGNWTIPPGVVGLNSCDNNVIMNSEPTFFSPAVSQQGGVIKGTKDIYLIFS